MLPSLMADLLLVDIDTFYLVFVLTDYVVACHNHCDLFLFDPPLERTGTEFRGASRHILRS